MKIALEKVDFLPPDRVTDDTSVLTLKTLVFEPMLRWQDGAPAPGLFAQWEMGADGRVWRLRLRNGARWHDGAAVRADEAAAFIRAILAARDMFGMPWSYGRYLAGARIDADADVLSIECPQPFPDLPDILSEFYLPRADAQGRWTVGTGPWRVTDFAPGQSAQLADDARRKLTVVAMPDAAGRVAALRAGDVDAATHLERAAGARAALPGFGWLAQPVTMSVIAYLNGAAGAFRDPGLRRAANLAVDRDRLVTDVMDGLAVPARTVVSPWHLGHAEAALSQVRHDPAEARALVAASAGPRDVVLRTPEYMPERAPEIAAFVAGAWRDIGLTVTVDIATDRPAYARDLGEKRMGDAAIFDSSPHSTFRVLDDKISGDSRAVWWQGVTDPEADRLFARARTTADPTARARAYGATLARLQAAPPWLYLFHPVECAAHAPGVTGLSLDHKGILRIAPATP